MNSPELYSAPEAPEVQLKKKKKTHPASPPQAVNKITHRLDASRGPWADALLLMGHLDVHLLSQELLDLLLRHGGGRGHGRGWWWAPAVHVGEGVEPGQGQGTAEGRLHPLPASGLLPGRLLLLKALDALQEEESLGSFHVQNRYLSCIMVLTAQLLRWTDRQKSCCTNKFIPSNIKSPKHDSAHGQPQLWRIIWYCLVIRLLEGHPSFKLRPLLPVLLESFQQVTKYNHNLKFHLIWAFFLYNGSATRKLPYFPVTGITTDRCCLVMKINVRTHMFGTN